MPRVKIPRDAPSPAAPTLIVACNVTDVKNLNDFISIH